MSIFKLLWNCTVCVYQAIDAFIEDFHRAFRYEWQRPDRIWNKAKLAELQQVYRQSITDDDIDDYCDKLQG